MTRQPKLFTRKILSAVLMLIAVHGWSQDFPGYSTGNYTGVNGTFFNPANIADSRHRTDFNALSVNTFVGNNQASFRFQDLGKSYNADSLRQQVMGNNAGASRGMVNIDLHGPSYMFNTGAKSMMAATTRLRVMVNIDNIDGKLLSTLAGDFKNDPQLPFTIYSGENMRVAVHAWKENGLSYGRVLADKGIHFLKGGISLKYLSGIANGFIGLDNFRTTLNEDKDKGQYYLNGASGSIATGYGGLRISDLHPMDFIRRQGVGFGWDLGFTYEYRPDYEAYEVPGRGYRRKDRNKYKWKASFALLDMGSITYEKDMKRSGAYGFHVKGDERFYLNELDSVAVDDYKTYFSSRPEYFTESASNATSTYKVFLPATLQAFVDYHLHRGFYASFAGQLPLAAKNTASTHSITSFTFTPRYEGKGIGLYVPVNYNSLTKFNAGASLRMGPLFVGSGSVLTAVLGRSRQVDFHAGFHLGSLQRNVIRKQEQAEKKKSRKERRAQKEQEHQVGKSSKSTL